MSLKNSKAIVSLCLLLLIHTFVIAQTPTTSSNDTYISKELETQLLVIASEAITTQLQILVSGDLYGSLKNKKYAHLYRDTMMSKFKFQIVRRNKLKETRQDYKDFKTNLVIKVAAREGNKITLKITETTELKMDVPGGPPFYAYVDDHIFEFIYTGQEWKLVKDDIIRPKPPQLNPNDLPS